MGKLAKSVRIGLLLMSILIWLGQAVVIKGSLAVLQVKAASDSSACLYSSIQYFHCYILDWCATLF